MKMIKLSFSSSYRKVMGIREGRTWQHRFWNHIIRDQTDLNHHVDYIHYNPVKHGLVNDSLLWQFSSYYDFIKEGAYSRGWGVKEIKFDGEYGE